MKRALVAILALMLGCAAQAQTSGFPSKPRFQNVTVTGAASGTCAPSTQTSVFLFTGGTINPRLQLVNTAGAANARIWEQVTTGTDWLFRTQNDTCAAQSLALDFTRSGAALTAMQFGNATDNPSFAFNGSGTLSFANATASNFINPLTDNAVDLGSAALRFRTINMTLVRDGTNGQYLTSSGTTAILGSGTTWTALQFGNGTSNPTYSFLGAGATTFASSVLLNNSGGTNSRVTTTSTSGCNGYFLQNSGVNSGYIGMNVGAGTCTSGAVAGELTIDHSNLLRFSHAGTQEASLTTAGVFNVASGGDLQVNGVSACRSDGTNCPTATGAGANFLGVMTTTDTRTSNVTPTCATGLTVSLPNATARYQFTAMLRFTGGGITANGWRVNMTTGGGTHVVRWMGSATTNTTTANTAPTSNGQGIVSDFTATFNAAGVDTFVTLIGTDSVTSPATPTLCVAWAQNTSNATASSLLDSSIVVTRLN